MSKNVLAIGASSSKNSINRQFAHYAATLVSRKLSGAEIKVLDLNDFEMPIYSIDKEKENGIPNEAKVFQEQIQWADLIVISFAEHNGSYTSAFKNVMDWKSRLEGKVWENKAMILLSTSPGARGGATVLASAALSFPHMGADVKGTFSLPSFFDNFKDGKLVDEKLEELNAIIEEA